MSEVSVYPADPYSDAFGRMRVSQPNTLFDSKLLLGKEALFWDEAITDTSGNAASTHVAANSLVTMYVEAEDSIVRQTRRCFNYQPGKSQLVLMTGILTAGGTGITGRLGLFNANDGLFFQVSGTTISVVERNNASDTATAQASWNLDTMDGTGRSGFNIDFSKAQIFVIDFEWLSLGRVRYGFVMDGKVIYCHESSHINTLTAPYMHTPNLPLRYEIASAAGGTSATMKHICSTVISEAGSDFFGAVQQKSTGATAISAATADSIYAIAGIRLSTAAADHGIEVALEGINIMNEAAQDFEWVMYLNPTVAASSAFTYANASDAVQWAVSGSTACKITDSTTAYEIKMHGGYIKSGQQSGAVAHDLETPLRLGRKLASTRDEFVLAARPLGNNASFQGGILWRERL